MNLDYRKGNLALKDINFKDRVYNKSEAFYQSQLANMLLVKELARRYKGIIQKLMSIFRVVFLLDFTDFKF